MFCVYTDYHSHSLSLSHSFSLALSLSLSPVSLHISLFSSASPFSLPPPTSRFPSTCNLVFLLVCACDVSFLKVLAYSISYHFFHPFTCRCCVFSPFPRNNVLLPFEVWAFRFVQVRFFFFRTCPQFSKCFGNGACPCSRELDCSSLFCVAFFSQLLACIKQLQLQSGNALLF